MQRVEVEKVTWEFVWDMWLMKTDSKEKRLTVVVVLSKERSCLFHSFQVRQFAAWLLSHLYRTEEV